MKDGRKDLNVLNLKEQEQTKGYDKLEGTGVNALRTISGILIVLGVILSIAGIVQIADGAVIILRGCIWVWCAFISQYHASYYLLFSRCLQQ